MESWLVINIVFNTFSMLFHLLGICLLRNVKQGRLNANNILVTFLSVTEILFVVTFTWSILDYNVTSGLSSHVVGSMVHYVVVTITANRYLACVYPVAYRRYATKKVVRRVLVCVFTFNLATGTSVWLAAHYFDSKIAAYWWLVYIAIIFVFCVYAYTRIYMKVAASTLRTSRNLPGRQNLKLTSVLWNFVFHQGQATSLMIVAVHFLFVFLPISCWSICIIVFPRATEQAFDVFAIALSVNCMVDAFIYIYTDKSVRKVFVAKVKLISLHFKRRDIAPRCNEGFAAAVVTTRARRTTRVENKSSSK